LTFALTGSVDGSDRTVLAAEVLNVDSLKKKKQ
jgi:hypothetical protein